MLIPKPNQFNKNKFRMADVVRSSLLSSYASAEHILFDRWTFRGGAVEGAGAQRGVTSRVVASIELSGRRPPSRQYKDGRNMHLPVIAARIWCAGRLSSGPGESETREFT